MIENNVQQICSLHLSNPCMYKRALSLLDQILSFARLWIFGSPCLISYIPQVRRLSLRLDQNLQQARLLTVDT